MFYVIRNCHEMFFVFVAYDQNSKNVEVKLWPKFAFYSRTIFSTKTLKWHFQIVLVTQLYWSQWWIPV